jgi:hypothetical protein
MKFPAGTKIIWKGRGGRIVEIKFPREADAVEFFNFCKKLYDESNPKPK